MTRVEEQIRADIVEAGRRLYARAYIASNDGNISARLDDRRLITTPKSVSKGFMTPDMMVVVDYDGNKVSGERDPSTELPMHLEIYRNRPDTNAVVHAHPPIATGFAVAGIPYESLFAHHWFVGTDDNVDRKQLKEKIDEHLKKLNDDYAVERSAALKEIFVDVLPVKTFYDWMESKGKVGGQNKFPRVMKNAQLEDWKKFLQHSSNGNHR